MGATSYGISAAPSTAYPPHDVGSWARHTRRAVEQLEILETRVKERLKATGLSARGASLAAVNSPDVVRYIWERQAMPSADKLARIAAVLGTTVDYLLGKSEEPGEAIAPVPGFKMPSRTTRDLPVYGTALAADRDFLDRDGHPTTVEQVDLLMSSAMDYIIRPPLLVGRSEIFAVYVSGESMSPRFFSGDAVLVEPNRPAAIGDDVLVLLRGAVDQGEEITGALIKKLVRRSASFVELEQYNPPLTFRIPTADIHKIHRIKPWPEAHGI
jgi:phage repressor protein C with HTH and peptisase S24 domain